MSASRPCSKSTEPGKSEAVRVGRSRRRRGFTDIDVIDDLGRTASGTVERPGLTASVAAPAGQVGAVLCSSMPAAFLAMAATGTIFWNCAVWWKPVSSTSTACTTLPAERPPAPCYEGQHQRVRAGIIRSRMYEAASIKSEARRVEDLDPNRLLLGPAHRLRPRSGSAAAGGDQACVPEVP